MRKTTTIAGMLLLILFMLSPALAQEPDGGEAEREVQEAQREGRSGEESQGETKQGEGKDETEGKSEEAGGEELVDEGGEAEAAARGAGSSTCNTRTI